MNIYKALNINTSSGDKRLDSDQKVRSQGEGTIASQ